MKITEEVVDRVEAIMRLLNTDKISSDPLVAKPECDNLRFLAQMQATCLLREDNGRVFGHPLIREYCLHGKMPKECFEYKEKTNDTIRRLGHDIYT